MSLRRPLAFVLSLFVCAGVLAPLPRAVAEPDKAGPTATEMAKLLEPTAGALVRVEYTLQYDKGEGPGMDYSAYYSAWLSAASGAEPVGDDPSNYEQFIRDERPMERSGYLIAPNRVICNELYLHPRFVKSIKVLVGGERIDAKPSAHFRAQDMMVLELASPVKNAAPLAFDGAKEPPFYNIRAGQVAGKAVRSIGPMGGGVSRTESGDLYTRVTDDCLIVDKTGRSVALWSVARMPIDNSWKTGPDKWESLSEADYASANKVIDTAAGNNILRTIVNFRSPRTEGMGGQMSRYRQYGGYGGEDMYGGGGMTEWNGSALVLSPDTAIVFLGLRPQVTSRLEKVRLFTPDGQTVNATFAGTLRDYNGFLVKLEKPLGAPCKLFAPSITDLRDKLQIRVSALVRGETRTVYLTPDRIVEYGLGYQRTLIPGTAGGGSGMRSYDPYGRGEASTPVNALYTISGELSAVSLARREKIANQMDPYGGYRSYSRSGGEGLLAAAQLAELLTDRAKFIDPENRPLTEEEENRIAWLGVELQSMDPALARANNVVEQTGGGRTGGLVTFIYADSPAAKAGVEVGDILLRLHVDGQPKPLDVSGGYDMNFGFERYFAMLDRMPAEAFDQMPALFAGAETPLMRQLTDIGFGTPFKAEVFRNGKIEFKDFKITQGPDHFGSAKRFKSDATGLTVRNVTYEVRRFLQMAPDDPGVIVSKIERGEKGAVAGIRPYEIITAIDEKPIKSVDEFETITKDGGDFRLSVKRLSTSRIVKVKLENAKDAAARKAKDKDKVVGDDEGMPDMRGLPGMGEP